MSKLFLIVFVFLGRGNMFELGTKKHPNVFEAKDIAIWNVGVVSSITKTVAIVFVKLFLSVCDDAFPSIIWFIPPWTI